MKNKDFKNLELVKKINREIVGYYSADCYYHLSIFYSFLAELKLCFNNSYNFFDKEIYKDFNELTENRYKNDILKTFASYNIVID